ncbi:hypothetical protein AB0368_10430 [Actinoplanes sp. NPDC051475]|uniref:hypothetical protein n=1 Tax=Actinoplanes sp. NPDC051475 TaxID=3157225 RepID=UPI00344E1B36
MTSTPPPPQPLSPEPPSSQPASRPVLPVIRPLRDLAAYAFVAAPAVWLFVAIIRLVPSGVGQDFLTRVQNSFYSYVNVETIALPLAAVLLATLVEPRHRHARLITVVALVEYAVAGFFAVVFGFLIGVVKIAGFSIRVAFEELLVRTAWLAVFAVAAYAVFLIWRTLFHTPRPKQQPGVYGQPQQQWGQQQPYGQPGYPQQPGQPGFPQPGQPGFPQPGQPGFPQPGFPQPGQPGQPGQPQSGQWGQPAWGQPTAHQPTVQQGFVPATPPPASVPPAQQGPGVQPGPGTPPGPFAPAPGHPHGAPSAYAPRPVQPHQPASPQPQGGPADPTQTLPARADDEDRTRIVGEEPPKG